MAFVGDDVYGPGGRLSSEGLVMVRNEKKKWGFLALDGSVPVAPAYEKVGHFFEGLAAVQKRQSKGPPLWGFVDRTGAMKIPPRFPKASWPRVRFSEGLCAVAALIPEETAAIFRRNGIYPSALYGYIDKTGEWAIEPKFAYADPFCNGLAKVVTPNGEAYVDRTGTLVWESPRG
jgi:hypothetical protein